MFTRLAAVVALGAAAAVFVGACSRPAPGGPIGVLLSSPDVAAVSGLSSAEAAALASANLPDAEWRKILRVTVSGADIPIAGRYAVAGERIEFRPAFPFDAGQAYTVTFTWEAMPVRRPDGPVVATLSLPAGDRTPVTRVVAIHPSADRWPANLLRAYIHFSGPMGSTSGVDHVRLRDERGHDVEDAFLPLEADFWNADHTRYTVFFDPGRVKRGILPNRKMGRALVAGRKYTLDVAATWTDAQGRRLIEDYRREFLAGPAVEAPMDVEDWVLTMPQAGTRAPFVVTFPWPIDHGLSLRALSVSGPDGARIPGDPSLAAGDQRWTFTPRDAWIPGEYRLTADPILEDPSGNQFGRAFEVEARAEPATAPRLRAFQIAK